MTRVKYGVFMSYYTPNWREEKESSRRLRCEKIFRIACSVNLGSLVPKPAPLHGVQECVKKVDSLMRR